MTRKLIEDGRQHLLLGGPIPITCPVHLLHGQRDPDVPWQTALRLAECLESDYVTIELIKAGDHRLSREPDLARLTAAIERMAKDQRLWQRSISAGSAQEASFGTSKGYPAAFQAGNPSRK